MSLNTKRIVIFVMGLCLAAALLMVADQERRRHLSPDEMSLPQLKELVTDDSAACIDCHSNESPGIVTEWAKSKHAEKGVGCMACHHAERDEVDAWHHEGTYVASIVTPYDCQECHPQEHAEFAASHHSTAGMILHSKDNMLGEFVAGGPNAVLGCKQCHGSQMIFTKTFADGSTFTLDLEEIAARVQKDILDRHDVELKDLLHYKPEVTAGIAAAVAEVWDPVKDRAPAPRTRLDIDDRTWPNSGMGRFNPDGSLGTCNACHSRHAFSKALARQPDACGKCHMGPDHPQVEIYYESKHGVAFRNRLAEMNLDHPDWVVGRDYSAAPTCATCHMSAYQTADGIQPVHHDLGLRNSWTLRPPISRLTTSRTATLIDGKVVEDNDVTWDEKRTTMQGVCVACHSTSHIEGFYAQYDGLVNLYNEKFAKPGAALMKYIKDKGYLPTDKKHAFAHELNWIWFELWHHEGRRMRHGASMMGPDYTHWHGSYEVAKHFYNKFLPKIEHLAEKHEDEELEGMIADLLAMPEHAWYDGMQEGEAARTREHYKPFHKPVMEER